MSTDKIIEKINETLDQLMANAEEMQKVSLSSISKQHLKSYQKNQEHLLSCLVSLDNLLENQKTDPKNEKQTKASSLICEKLHKFAAINNRLVSLAADSSLSVIRFEKKTLAKRAQV